MNIDDIRKIRSNVKENQPLIHSVTNPISINECANAILAVGAKPIMAEYHKEVKTITKSAVSLNLNLGNITGSRLKSIKIAAKTAHSNNIPFVLDLVGVGCSDLRKKCAKKIIKKFSPTVIKGNYSEIYALCNSKYSSSGVDSDNSIAIKDVENIALHLSRKFGTTVLASGACDIICDGQKIVHIHNGTPQLSHITGTGCMLGCLTACYLSVCCNTMSVVLACAILGVCGELSETKKGNGTFLVNLIDNITTISNKALEQNIKMEVKKIEEI